MLPDEYPAETIPLFLQIEGDPRTGQLHRIAVQQFRDGIGLPEELPVKVFRRRTRHPDILRPVGRADDPDHRAVFEEKPHQRNARSFDGGKNRHRAVARKFERPVFYFGRIDHPRQLAFEYGQVYFSGNAGDLAVDPVTGLLFRLRARTQHGRSYDR